MMGKATTVTLLLALAMPLSAAAAPIAAPPGNSEADQYFETLPAPAGGRSPDTTKRVQDAVREAQLSASTASALEARGKAGLALANMAAQTAPPGKRSAKDGKGAGGGSPPALAGVSVPKKQGLGALFPIILALTAVGAAAFAVARRRRSAVK